MPESVYGRKPPKSENFTKFWTIKCPAFARFISTVLSACMQSAFHDWCLKIGRIRSRGFEVNGV